MNYSTTSFRTMPIHSSEKNNEVIE